MANQIYLQEQPSLPGPLTDAQKRIDQEIAIHEAAIHNLRTRRNAASHILKLPVELLGDVFVLTKSLMYYDAAKWLAITEVCRSWREIAINTPSLWNSFDMSELRNLEWARTVLR